MFKDVLGIFPWTLACFCILLRFPELLKRYVSRTVTCIWPSAKNSSLPSLNVKNKESELHNASGSTCQDVNAPKKWRNFTSWKISGLLTAYQVSVKSLETLACQTDHTFKCNPIYVLTHAPFHTQKPSILVPAFSPSPRREGKGWWWKTRMLKSRCLTWMSQDFLGNDY